MLQSMYLKSNISKEVFDFCKHIEDNLKERFIEIDNITEYNQLKIIQAMQKNKVSDIHFAATTGYGYNDLGRDTLEDVYASVFNTEAALVRPQLMSGTHALTVALFGNLRPNDELLSPVGKPYDTLEKVIGIRNSNGSLKDFGITYKQVDLLPDGAFDFNKIKKTITKNTRMVTIQRSKGYSTRPTLSVEQIGDLISFIKEINPNIICMVDNCYGEFVQDIEPSDVGADLSVGSLIKNIGGGLAPIGGYIVGKNDYVEASANRLTAPGVGKEIGATLGLNQVFFQGLFFAPQVVSGALKGAILCSNVFEQLGFEVFPNGNSKRYDIVQAINMRSQEGVIAFCEGIQAAAAVDSFVTPIPSEMPGYDVPVIMAAGAFVQGSSIELSADAPMKPPYTVYFQGGLTYNHSKLGTMNALQQLINKKIITL